VNLVYGVGTANACCHKKAVASSNMWEWQLTCTLSEKLEFNAILEVKDGIHKRTTSSRYVFKF
jgi:hypothetical protein